MKKIIILGLLILCLTANIESKKTSRGRSSSSSRSSSKKTNQPAPTSLSYPQQASAPKPTLFGWQEKSAQKPQTWKQSNPSNTGNSRPSSNTGHSYPSSNTGLSGNNQPKKTGYEDNVQKSNVPLQQNSQHVPSQTNNQGHNYPASNTLSGNSGSGASYPQGSGLSGSNAAAPQYPGNSAVNRPQTGGSAGYPQGSGLSGSNVAPPPYPGNSAVNRPQAGGSAGYPQGSGISGSNGAPPPYGNNGANAYHPQGGGNINPNNNFGGNNPYHQGAPPPYTNVGNNYYHHPQGPPPSYFGHNPGSYGPQMPGYYGNYMGNGRGFGGVSRGGSTLAGVGLAGAGIGTVLTGLALWNLARSTGHHKHTVIYDNRGQPVGVAPGNDTAPAVDPILGDLVNCSLTISSDNATEVLAIPCSIATSFTPEADVKDAGVDNGPKDSTKCTVTVVTKAAREFSTTIPCSILLNTAAENNVTEPPVQITEISTTLPSDELFGDQPSPAKLANVDHQDVTNPPLNCTEEMGEMRDPINPCYSVKHNLTVVPLPTTEKP